MRQCHLNKSISIYEWYSNCRFHFIINADLFFIIYTWWSIFNVLWWHIVVSSYVILAVLIVGDMWGSDTYQPCVHVSWSYTHCQNHISGCTTQPRQVLHAALQWWEHILTIFRFKFWQKVTNVHNERICEWMASFL